MKYLELAKKEIGVKEVRGAEHNPAILQYGKDAGIDWYVKDETPWCAVFVNAMLARAGHRGTKSALAKSFLNWGKPISKPRKGAIVIFDRTPNPVYGHVGFLDDWDRKYFYVVGGNQTNSVTKAKFLRSAMTKDGLRWPLEEPVSLDTHVQEKGINTLQKGDKGEEVLELQRYLNTLNYNVEEDGVYGEKTEAAVRKAQEFRGLEVDGVYGPATRSAVEKKAQERLEAKKRKTRDTIKDIGAIGTGGAIVVEVTEVATQAESIVGFLTSGNGLVVALGVGIALYGAYSLYRHLHKRGELPWQ